MKNKKYDSINKLLHKEILGRHVDSYLPWYDEYSDYNTNAKSYYDYLARYNRILKVLTDVVNHLLARDIDVLESETIKLEKIGSWIAEDECKDLEDLIKLIGHVKVSKEKDNAIVIKSDGLYTKDLSKLIKDLENKIPNTDDLLDRIKELEKLINNMQGLDLKQLMLGRDYEIYFHNGFYSPTRDLVLSVGETKEILDLHVTTHSTSGRILKHDGDLRDTRQSLRPGKDIPEESKVFSIKFLNDYEYLNSKEVYMEVTTPNVWHMLPVSERASWPVQLTPHNIDDMINFSWRNFADGYSQQLIETYKEPIKLTYGMVESKVTFKK